MTARNRAGMANLIATDLPTNGQGLITAAMLRQVVGDLTDSTTFFFGDAPILGVSRAQIPSIIVPMTSFVASGYAAVGDDGAGALYVRGAVAGLQGIQDASGQWWNLYNGGVLKWGWFGAKGDGATDDSAAIIACCAALSAAGGGIAMGGAKTYWVASSVNVTAMSNVTLAGAGMDKTIIKCSAALNGSDNLLKNDLICALNFGATAPYAFKNINVLDMTLDCANQNPSGVPVGATAGYSLAGIELQNVDFVTIARVRILKAFGNGAVCGSLVPTQAQAVRGCVIRDCIFDTCVRGVLPQYKTPGVAPAGLCGNVIQMGAADRCSIISNIFINPGADAIEIDEFANGFVLFNQITGAGGTPVGANNGAGTMFQQRVGGIAAGSHIENTVISKNILKGAGGIWLHGDMGSTYGGGAVPGPTNCVIADNVIIQPYAPVGVVAPAFPVSGGTFTNTNSLPLLAYISGGVGVTVTIQRGGSGGFVTNALGPAGAVAMAAGDVLSVTYTGSPTWTHLLAANIFAPGIEITGGSINGASGQAIGNTVRGNKVVLPGTVGMLLVDCSLNTVVENFIQDCGQASAALTGYVGIQLATAFNQTGCGSSENNISGNTFSDDRSPAFNAYNYIDDAPGGVVRCVGNNVSRNRMALANTFSIATNSPTTYTNDNWGPGAGVGWVSVKQMRTALQAIAQLVAVNTAVGAVITTSQYISWNNSDRIYFSTTDSLYILIKATLAYTDNQMATLFLSALLQPQ